MLFSPKNSLHIFTLLTLMFCCNILVIVAEIVVVCYSLHHAFWPITYKLCLFLSDVDDSLSLTLQYLTNTTYCLMDLALYRYPRGKVGNEFWAT